jgi:hypothetical protein
MSCMQMRAIQKTCKDIDLGEHYYTVCFQARYLRAIELVFLDAPHVLTPIDLAESFNTSEEFGAEEATDNDPALTPRGWWKVDAGRTKMTGIGDSLTLLRDTLKKDHYDVRVLIRDYEQQH